jgi:hypothetical protein
LVGGDVAVVVDSVAGGEEDGWLGRMCFGMIGLFAGLGREEEATVVVKDVADGDFVAVSAPRFVADGGSGGSSGGDGTFALGFALVVTVGALVTDRVRMKGAVVVVVVVPAKENEPWSDVVEIAGDDGRIGSVVDEAENEG